MDNLFSSYPNLWVKERKYETAEVMNPNQYLPLLEKYWGRTTIPLLIERLKNQEVIWTPEHKFSYANTTT